MNRKLQNIFEFFKSTLPVTMVFAAAGFLFGGLSGAVPVALSIGFGMSLVVKQYREAHLYQFYRNNGLTRLQLWAVSYVLTCIGILVAAAFIILLT